MSMAGNFSVRPGSYLRIRAYTIAKRLKKEEFDEA
jgi:hypothetical protein